MAVMTMKFDVPDSITFDRKALQEKLTAFAKILISSPSLTKITENQEDMHMFDCFSGDWGGNRDSHEIADELYAGREDSRTIETYS